MTKGAIEYKITDTITKEKIESLLEMERENCLTPEEFVRRAKNKNHPWHSDLYSLTDEQAVYQYRLQTARVIINKVKVYINNVEYPAFENVNVKIDKKHSKQYVTRIGILSDEELRQQMIEKAMKFLLYWKSQYENYDEFSEVVVSINNLIKQ